MSPVDFKKRPCHPVEFKGVVINNGEAGGGEVKFESYKKGEGRGNFSHHEGGGGMFCGSLGA